MKHQFSLDIPIWGVLTLVATAFIVVSLLFLIGSFFHAWFTQGFRAALDTLEVGAVKIAKAAAYPFIGTARAIAFVLGALWSPINEFLVERPWLTMAEFFAWIAGADLEKFRKASSSDRKEKTAMGITMFFIMIITSALAGNS